MKEYATLVSENFEIETFHVNQAEWCLYFTVKIKLVFIKCMNIHCRDGQKMSKRKKNYPDPLTVVNKYGADALR